METQELFASVMDHEPEVDDLSNLKDRLVHSILVTTCLIGLLILVPAVYVAWNAGSIMLGTIYVIAYAVILGITLLPAKYFNIKAGMLVMVPILLTVNEFISYGIASSGTVYAILAIFLASALFSLKSGLIVTSVIGLAMLVIGGLITSGYWYLDPARLENSFEFVHWVIRVAQITLAGNLLILPLRFLVMRINNSLNKSLQLTESLRSERHRLRRIISAIPGSVLICSNDFTGQIMWSNNVAEREFQLGQSTLIGLNLADLFHSEDDFVNVCARINNRQKVISEEVRILRADNSTFWAQISASVIEMADAPVAVYILQDVDQMRQTQKAIQQLQKTESLGLMAGGIAHDFRNILTAISSHSNIALKRLDDADPARKSITKAIKAADKGAQLTKQLLQYAGNKQIEVAQIDMNELILENLQLLGVAVSSNVNVTHNLADNLSTITGDKAQLQQVVMNLIINAAQAMGERQGDIVISTERLYVSPEDLLLWKIGSDEMVSGDYLHLKIADTGPGMDTKTLNSIFDPFFTTKEEGTGLGLATVLGIVRSHNGGLRVSSEVGQGTDFDLIFPLVDR